MPVNLGETLLQRYRIEKKLGEGGFGAVYCAYDSRLDVFCAIKESFDLSIGAAHQFKLTAEMLSNLRHPYLPRVTDFFDIKNKGLFLVMDFIHGEDLLKRIQRMHQPLSEEEAVVWLRQICEALIYIHSENPPIIHRDIKPQNIIIDHNGNAILVDFGLAKRFETGQRTSLGARGLTPGFASLEQYGTGVTDARSDIYSLGATAYFMLTAQIPLESIQRVLCTSTLPTPFSINHQISESLSDAIMQALEIDPRHRQPTAQKFKINLPIKNSSYYFRLGLSQHQSGDLDGAIISYSEAIRHNKSHANAYFNRGFARKNIGYSNWELDYYTAFKLNPEYALFFAINEYLIGSEDLYSSRDEEINKITEVIFLNPNNAKAYLDRGLIRRWKHDMKGAISDFNATIKLDPSNAYAYYLRGTVEIYVFELESALKDFNIAMNIDPRFIFYYYNIQSRGEKAVLFDLYTEIILQDTNNADIYFRRGNVYQLVGEFDKSIEDYTLSIHLNPAYANAYYCRGKAYMEQENYQGALDDYSHFIKMCSQNSNAYYCRGNVREAMKDCEGAMNDYSEAIRLEPDNTDALSRRGNLFLINGDLNKAINDCTKAIMNPDIRVFVERDAYRCRGNALRLKGDSHGAAIDLEKADFIDTF